MTKLFGVSPLIQKKEVDKYCFDICGKVLVGGLGCDETGPLFPCRQEDCPYEDKRTPFLWTTKDTDGSDVQIAVRKLKELPK